MSIKKIPDQYGSQNFDRKIKVKKKLKTHTQKLIKKQARFLQQSKQILSQILQIDYLTQIKPHKLKANEIQTYGCFTEFQVKQIFEKTLTFENFKTLIIDSIKVCYLYTPIIQGIKTQLMGKKDECKVKQILEIIVRGQFYQFLKLKTQQPKFLINNRSTQINIKTIISGILTFVSKKLTMQNISDVLLFYRLEETLYQTAPCGLPFDFEKIMKLMKKIDRNITSQKFNKWEKKIKTVEKNRCFLEPYHFVYLISLSEPIKKKKMLLFQIDKNESKFEVQNQVLQKLNEKNNFIDFEKRKTEWKNDIKVRGLTFVGSYQVNKLKDFNKKFVDIRKQVINHKRSRSAHIQNEAKQRVKQQLMQRNEKENQLFLQKYYSKPVPKQRKLLKRFYRMTQAKVSYEKAKQKSKRQFHETYTKSMSKHVKNNNFIDKEDNKLSFQENGMNFTNTTNFNFNQQIYL